MANGFYSTNVLLIIILFLSIVLLFNILYGCRASVEGFEDVEMKADEADDSEIVDESMEQLAETIKPILDEKALMELVNKVKTTTDSMKLSEEKEIVPEKKPVEDLSKKETELFEAISTNKVTNDDLEKLVKAGVLTEKMIEKFLEKMDDKNDSEPVVEGFSCGRDYATF